MTKEVKDGKSDRRSRREALLEEALAQPGVRELMDVYGNWQTADSGFNSYRSVVNAHPVATTTAHANIQK
ncbi:MAG: hypothetical protein OXL41_04715 [Nitrospinae bacterium]|nr:hypothetical protein [Nitrospinota bacterium]